MNLTYYPLAPFEIKQNRCTVIQCANPRSYTDLINGLRDLSDKVVLTDAEHNRVEISKGICWIGDCFQSPEISKAFQAGMEKKIVKNVGSERLSQFIQIDQQLKSLVMDELLMYDLPLTVDAEFSLSKLLKTTNISFVSDLKTQPYDIIETVLKCASDLDERGILVLTNVHQYLSVSQFQELVRLIETLDLYTLLIEFSELKSDDYFANCQYYYIDQDFVDWRAE